MRTRDIAVIGAGFSGTMAAIQLLRQLPADCRIILFGRQAGFARGLAYSTENPAHLLNVRAANMSAYPDQPGHFVDWLTRYRGVPAGSDKLFAQRSEYGRYLEDQLRDALEHGAHASSLIVAESAVVDIEPVLEGYSISVRTGEHYHAEAVVLAMGNLRSLPERPHDLLFDPWQPGALAGLKKGAPLLILGTGLTMVDAALTCKEGGYDGSIIAISRRGLVPQAHAATKPWPTPVLDDNERTSAARLLRRVRREVEEAIATGGDWRAVIDSLRPITASLWQGLTLAQKRSVLRHLRPYWDIHRHRMAPQASATVHSMLEQGELRVMRGHLLNIDLEGTPTATVFDREAGCARTIEVQRVIDARGLAAIGNVDDELIRNLQRRGLVRLDALRLGLDVTDCLEVLDRDGHPQPRVMALGPVTRGVFWECVAVPDIRVQAAALAARLVQKVVG